MSGETLSVYTEDQLELEEKILTRYRELSRIQRSILERNYNKLSDELVHFSEKMDTPLEDMRKIYDRLITAVENLGEIDLVDFFDDGYLYVGELRALGKSKVLDLLTVNYGIDKSNLIEKVDSSDGSTDTDRLKKKNVPIHTITARIDTAARAFGVIMKSEGVKLPQKIYFDGTNARGTKKV